MQYIALQLPHMYLRVSCDCRLMVFASNMSSLLLVQVSLHVFIATEFSDTSSSISSGANFKTVSLLVAVSVGLKWNGCDRAIYKTICHVLLEYPLS